MSQDNQCLAKIRNYQNPDTRPELYGYNNQLRLSGLGLYIELPIRMLTCPQFRYWVHMHRIRFILHTNQIHVCRLPFVCTSATSTYIKRHLVFTFSTRKINLELCNIELLVSMLNDKTVATVWVKVLHSLTVLIYKIIYSHFETHTKFQFCQGRTQTPFCAT